MDLVQAVTEGNSEEVLKLLQEGADPNQLNYYYGNKEPILFEATRNQSSMQIMLDLLDFGANANSKNNMGITAIFTAETPEKISKLIDKGADVNLYSRQQNQITVLENPASLDCAKELIKLGAKPDNKNTYNQTCIFCVSSLDIFTYYKDFVEYNYLDTDGRSILHTHAINASYDIVKVIIEMGFDINAVDNFGLRPINYLNDPEMIKYVYEKGARF